LPIVIFLIAVEGYLEVDYACFQKIVDQIRREIVTVRRYGRSVSSAAPRAQTESLAREAQHQVGAHEWLTSKKGEAKVLGVGGDPLDGATNRIGVLVGHSPLLEGFVAVRATVIALLGGHDYQAVRSLEITSNSGANAFFVSGHLLLRQDGTHVPKLVDDLF
jgi:hypothetical protein